MKRVYKKVSIEQVDRGDFTILLDNKRIKTPAKKDFLIASERLARAVAGEWDAQDDEFVPDRMKLTQLVSTTIDVIEPDLPSAIEGLLKFLATDLVCYRAEQPHELAMLQERRFDPLLEWMKQQTGHSLAVVYGIMPVTQPEALLAQIRSRLETKSPAELTVLHVAASLTASLVIPLALTEGRLTADEAFEAGFVDEIYQTRRVRKDKVIMEKLDAARAELAALQQFMYLIS